MFYLCIFHVGKYNLAGARSVGEPLVRFTMLYYVLTISLYDVADLAELAMTQLLKLVIMLLCRYD